MASNAELTAENKELKKQVQDLQEQLTADTVSKSDYDAISKELADLKKHVEDMGFPTLSRELENAKKAIETLTNERNAARNEVMASANKIRDLQAKQRVEEPVRSDEKLAVDKSELRMLAATCLTSSCDDAGRPFKPGEMEDTGPKKVAVAIEFAKEICRQIP